MCSKYRKLDDIDRLALGPGKRVALRDPRDDEALAILIGQHDPYKACRY